MLPITRATAERFCRCCLQELKQLKNDKQPNHDLQVEKHLFRSYRIITDMVYATPGEEGQEIKIHPKILCHSCYTKTRIFYEFRDKSVCVFIALKEIISEYETNMNLIENIKMYCTTCLRRINEKAMNVLEDEEIYNWIRDCTGVDWKATEVSNAYMPTSICNRCYKKLRNFVEYRKVARDSHEYLEGILGSTEDSSQADSGIQSISRDGPELVQIDKWAQRTLLDTQTDVSDVEIEHNQVQPEEDPLIELYASETSNPTSLLSAREDLTSDIDETLPRVSSDIEYAELQKLNLLPEKLLHKTSTSEDATTVRSKLIECEKCEKRFRKQFMYEAHYRGVHEGVERPFICDKCSKSFRIYAVMRRHLLESHAHDLYAKNETKKIKSKWTCLSCKMAFETKGLLSEHYAKTHEGLRPFKCDYCLKTFKRRDHLSDHINAVHHGIRSFQCSYCNKKFAARKTLRIHEMGHTGERPFTCDYCHKTFRQMSDLKIHQEKHTTDPSLLCPICYRAKSNFEELTNHIAQHKSNGFQCTKCGKTFKKHSHLKEHESAVHLRLRPFKCNYCVMTFAARKTLINHELIHTAKWPVQCKICQKGFRANTNLRKHMNTHNPSKKHATKQKKCADNIPETDVLSKSMD